MQTMNITSWAVFKTLVAAKKLQLQYASIDNYYAIYAPEAQTFLWQITLIKDGGADVTDFETNFQPDANQPLEIRAAAGTPNRVVPTAQPLNTTEKWKGYHMEMAANELEKTILINFPIDVYLRGGSIFSQDCTCNDYITVDIVWTDYPATVLYPNLLEAIHMMKGIQLPFVSAECMKFPPMCSLQITYHKEDDSKTRCVTAIANFFEPPQM